MAFKTVMTLIVSFYFVGCVSQDLRLPATATDVYKNFDLKQGLMLVAQNNILFHIPAETLVEVAKSEVDSKCRRFEEPFWSDKISVYLNYMRQHPEWMTRMNVIELKKGDTTNVQLQKDMDGAVTLSLQYIKTESRGKIGQTTAIPCGGTLAEYVGKELVKTEFEFPTVEQLRTVLDPAPERGDIARFKFSNDFATYLAERGTIVKFSHEMSFEKTSQGRFVMANLLNRLSDEIKKPKASSHLNLWLKKINENSRQAQLIQMFSLENDRELKAGIKIDSQGDFARRTMGQLDLTYIFTSYKVDADTIDLVSLENLNICLQQFTDAMSGISFRKPANQEDKESYLNPGFSCAGLSKALPTVN